MKKILNLSVLLVTIMFFSTNCKHVIRQLIINRKILAYKCACTNENTFFFTKYKYFLGSDDPSSKDRSKGKRSYIHTPTNPYFT